MFGTQAQISLLQDFLTDAVQHNRWHGAKLGTLLKLLRDDLRAEIGLPAATGELRWIQVSAPGPQLPPQASQP